MFVLNYEDAETVRSLLWTEYSIVFSVPQWLDFGFLQEILFVRAKVVIQGNSNDDSKNHDNSQDQYHMVFLSPARFLDVPQNTVHAEDSQKDKQNQEQKRDSEIQ